MVRWLAYLFGVIGAALAACGSDVSAGQACDDLAAARCAQLATCSPFDLERRWGDVATCQSREQVACLEDLAVARSAETAARVETCAKASAAQTCAEFLSLPAAPSCVPIAGPLALGAACQTSSQCRSAFCSVAPTALCGTCTNAPAAGDLCTDNGCAPDMSCIAATMECEVPVVAAGACDRTMPCAVGLICVGATAAKMGSCMPAIEQLGAACDPQHAIAADCDAAAGLECDMTSLKCVMVPFADPGAPCGTIGSTVTRCSGGATCNIPGTTGAGTCLAPAVDGGSCDSTDGPDCLPPARCVPTASGSTAGTCQLPGSQRC